MDSQGEPRGASLVLRFPRGLANRPLVSSVTRECGLSFNILLARITPREEGLMVLRLAGENGALERGMEWLRRAGVSVDYVAELVTRDELRCTHCGACTSVCPVAALRVARGTMEVIFDGEACSGCGECVLACPVRAISVRI